jgi:hypothetical protein
MALRPSALRLAAPTSAPSGPQRADHYLLDRRNRAHRHRESTTQTEHKLGGYGRQIGITAGKGWNAVTASRHDLLRGGLVDVLDQMRQEQHVIGNGLGAWGVKLSSGRAAENCTTCLESHLLRRELRIGDQPIVDDLAFIFPNEVVHDDDSALRQAIHE